MAKAIVKKEAADLAAANQVNDMFGGGTMLQIPIGAPLPQLLILRETPVFGTPEGDTVKEVVGHIIHWHHANQYYDTDFGAGEAGPPACASSDGFVPDGGTKPQEGPCRSCKFNEYGSAKEGRGKACANTIRLYVLVDGEILPCIIKAPPSSLGSKESLIKWLTNAPNVANKAGVGTKYQPIKVKFTLHEKKFDQFSASVLDLKTVCVLTMEKDAEELQALANLYSDFMTNYLGRIQEDVGAESAVPPEVDDGQGTEVDGPEDIPI